MCCCGSYILNACVAGCRTGCQRPATRRPKIDFKQRQDFERQNGHGSQRECEVRHESRIDIEDSFCDDIGQQQIEKT
jgi:hypothetical protein